MDAANLLSDNEEAALTAKLADIERTTTRQVVVATVPSLQGYPIEDYAYRLGRSWGIGQAKANNGVVLLVAPNERRVWIAVGYGLESVLTDAVASRIYRDRITPRFRAGDYPAGISAGVDAIAERLRLPPEEAERRAAAEGRQAQARADGDGGSMLPLLFFLLVLVFVVLPMLRRSGGGRRYRSRGGFGGPVILWGPGFGGGFSGGFGGGSFGGGGGGFSGGGGSFGGGGAGGSW